MWFKVILLSFYLGNFIYISLKVLFGMKTALSTFEPIIRLAASSLFGKFKGNERSIYIRPRETQSGFGISTKKEIKLLWKGFSFLHGYHVIPEGWLQKRGSVPAGRSVHMRWVIDPFLHIIGSSCSYYGSCHHKHARYSRESLQLTMTEEQR